MMNSVHTKNFYKTKQWKQIRENQLLRNPLCARCLSKNKITAANVVHHKIPHKGNHKLFFDVNNLESLCKRCHDSDEQSIERRGYDKSVEADGWPKDNRHPMNRKFRVKD